MNYRPYAITFQIILQFIPSIRKNREKVIGILGIGKSDRKGNEWIIQ